MSVEVLDPISALPIGPEVPAHTAHGPERLVIAGRFIRLEPLGPDRHGASLWQETHGIGAAARWQYLFDEPFADEKSFHDFLARKAASTDPLFYAIIDQSTGRAVGFETLMRIDPTHRCIEVGNILYGKSLQRTPGATEAQYLLMRYIFEDSGLPPIRMEVQRTQRAVVPDSSPFRVYFRRYFPEAHDCSGPQSRYGLVLYARRRMAGRESSVRALAGVLKLRSRRCPAPDPRRTARRSERVSGCFEDASSRGQRSESGRERLLGGEVSHSRCVVFGSIAWPA